MARGESQTLLIWTIIFLIFSLIMIIVSVVMRSKYMEEASRLADATKKNSDLTTEVNTLKSEGTTLRTMIGFADTSLAISEVEAAFAKDLREFAPTLPQDATSYQTAFRKLADAHNDKTKENEDLGKKNIALSEDLARQEAKLASLKAEMQSELDRVKKECDDEVAKITTAKDGAENLAKKTEEDKNKVQEDSQIAIAEANRLRAIAEKLGNDMSGINRTLTKTVADYDSPTPTYHNAEIMWVSSNSELVRINVGSNHGLRPRMSFSVYSPDVKEISKESSKGKLEVIKILDGNTAEARVTEDILINPIIKGDIIYTPVWKPGQKIRFALSSGLDLDGDGNPDPHKVIGLIQRNQGEVDAYIDDLTGDIIDENGKKVREAFFVGRITDETRYLITGDKPDPDSSETLFNAYREMDETAEMYGMTKITLKDLLNFMGQRPQSQTVGFGPRNRAINDYEMEPDVANQRMPGHVFNKYENKDAEPATNNLTPVSPLFNQRKVTNPTGTASPLFKPRTPSVTTDK